MREMGSSVRLRIVVRGAVQGVGFRPFIYRLAVESGLAGWVSNSAQGVFIEVEGPRAALEKFLLRLPAEKPPRSSIQSLEAAWLDPAGYAGFAIRPSDPGGARTALVLPDIATCADCRAEIFDPRNRRYGYPFTNCTHCGPRFSILESLPYDRPNTSMKAFVMCPQCQAEYDDPRDRRFHAQPNACPACGPRLELWDRSGKPLPAATAPAGAPIAAAAEALRQGRIVAVKGLGGFLLMVAAHNEDAVCRLRALKHREEKPFALMFPSLAAIRAECEVSPLEERLLQSPEAPIVLLRRARAPRPAPSALPLAPSLAPHNPNLGVMLPYAPQYHLLLAALGFPVVATSGNLSDEPICTDEYEALDRLGGIADLFLVHNRPIVRHVDDSIVRLMSGRELVLRRARGYAPLPIQLPVSLGGPRSAPGHSVLAVGAHLKNAIALSVGPQVFIGQHIGDLETDLAFAAFRRVIADFQTLYDARPSIIAADAHPDYLSTQFAHELAARGRHGEEAQTPPPQLLTVQHHLAHVFSCLAENELAPPVLGVSWDGTGYGLDGTVWGGEFFLVTETACARAAHLRPFRLPGGDSAAREPRRAALGLLYEALGEAAFAQTHLAPLRAFTPAELAPLKTMLARRINSPLTSSVGRLFDAVAALTGGRQRAHYEGQAAMELEFALPDTASADEAYELPIRSEPEARSSSRAPLILDWAPMLEAILADLDRGVPVSQISARFHQGLVEAIIAVARRLGQPRVVLSGGCFQNRCLTEHAVRRLREAGFRPYWHQRVPPNDGGLALGQIVAALSPNARLLPS